MIQFANQGETDMGMSLIRTFDTVVTIDSLSAAAAVIPKAVEAPGDFGKIEHDGKFYLWWRRGYFEAFIEDSYDQAQQVYKKA